MIGTLIAIYGVYERKRDKASDRDIDMTKKFVKVDMKLDEVCRTLADITRNIDKTTEILNSVQKHLIEIDNKLENHDKTLMQHNERLDKLEEKLNG